MATDRLPQHADALRMAVQAVSRCRELAAITDVPGETTRTFLSCGMRRANERLSAWMRDAGMQVHTDAAGNLRGRLACNAESAKTLVLASHLDTVPNAGAFDGVLGITIALALCEAFRDADLPFHLELIAFSEEEGVRFGVPFLGSRALVGELNEELLRRTDGNGTTVREAIASYGLDVDALPSATLRNALGYLEFHIEQGPVLESEGLPLGVVEAIAGQSRFEIRFTGNSNHAGTTPMHLRHDAMCAAAEWIVEVERLAASTRGLVATVGSITALPGAGNVIAGEVRTSLDVRSPLDTLREDAADDLLGAARSIAARRGISIAIEERMQQTAVAMHPSLLRVLEDAVDASAAPVRRMVSGAGHDAMVVAPHIPAAMLFLRSPGGISHHPAEDVIATDVALAMEAGNKFLQMLAAREAVR